MGMEQGKWQEHLKAAAASGMRLTAYAAQHGINVRRLYEARYRDARAKAAKARKTTIEKIDAVAQGRVWTGVQAKERGLIDTVGSFGDALKSVACCAKLSGDYRVSYIEREGSRLERVLEMFGASSVQALGIELRLGLAPTGLPAGAAVNVARDMAWLSDLSEGNKPYLALTHCMCTPP